LAAQVSTAPVTVLLDPVVSLVSVPANLVAGVAVAPATVAGVTSAALSAVWPAGAVGAARIGGPATQWIALVARQAAAVPGGALPWPGGPGGGLLLAATSVLLLLLLFRRAWRSAALVPVVVLFLLVAPRWIPVLPGQRAPAGWSVAQCDVGQGSATVIRSGPDRAVLVDAGPQADLVDRCLRGLGVRHLDLVLITHFHADHVDGLAGALDGRGAPAVYVGPAAVPARQAQAVAQLVRGRTRQVTSEVSGTAGTGDWTVRWRLLAPAASAVRAALHAPTDPEGEVVNNLSVVLFAEVRGLRVAALGDVEPQAQRDLQRALTLGGWQQAGVDVVIVAHHGSARQEEQLYRRLHARVALIGVGADNDYGHPAPAALAMLERLGTAVFRTDQDGRVVVTGSSAGLRVVPQR